MTSDEWKEIQELDSEVVAFALKKEEGLDGERLKWAWNKMKEEIKEKRKENETLHQRVQRISETYIKLFISHMELLDDSLPHWRKHCQAELEQLRDFLEPHKKGR